MTDDTLSALQPMRARFIEDHEAQGHKVTPIDGHLRCSCGRSMWGPFQSRDDWAATLEAQLADAQKELAEWRNNPEAARRKFYKLVADSALATRDAAEAQVAEQASRIAALEDAARNLILALYSGPNWTTEYDALRALLPSKRPTP